MSETVPSDDERADDVFVSCRRRLDAGESLDVEAVLAEHADLAPALRERLEALSRLDRVFARFKELADRKLQLTDADLEAIVAEELGVTESDAFLLESLHVAGGTHLSPTATVRLRRNGSVLEDSAMGDGMIDAACAAIQRAAGVDGAKLVQFTVSSVTEGTDALGTATAWSQTCVNDHVQPYPYKSPSSIRVWLSSRVARRPFRSGRSSQQLIATAPTIGLSLRCRSSPGSGFSERSSPSGETR